MGQLRRCPKPSRKGYPQNNPHPNWISGSPCKRAHGFLVFPWAREQLLGWLCLRKPKGKPKSVLECPDFMQGPMRILRGPMRITGHVHYAWAAFRAARTYIIYLSNSKVRNGLIVTVCFLHLITTTCTQLSFAKATISSTFRYSPWNLLEILFSQLQQSNLSLVVDPSAKRFNPFGSTSAKIYPVSTKKS